MNTSTSTPVNPTETEPLADAQEQASATPETVVIGTDGTDPLEQMPGETFEAYVERTATLLDGRPDTIDRILENAKKQIASIEKQDAVEAAADAALLSGALSRIGTGPSEGSTELAETQAELDRLVAEGREDLKGMQADANGIAMAPVANTSAPTPTEATIASSEVPSVSTIPETATPVTEISTTDLDSDRLEGETVSAELSTPETSPPANASTTLETTPEKPGDPLRVVTSVEGDPMAPHTPEEVSRTYQEATTTIDQVLNLATQTDKAGLGDLLPSASSMHEWLPADSPLRLPFAERKHLTPEQAVRAEVDAYGIVLRAMVELDLSNLQPSGTPETAAASLEALAAVFDQAHDLRDRLPKAARSALVDAMHDASAHDLEAPGSLASDTILFSWANRTHEKTTSILRARAKKIRTGDLPKDEPLAGMPDAESNEKIPDE